MYSYTYLLISLYIFIVQVDEHRGVILEYRTCAYCLLHGICGIFNMHLWDFLFFYFFYLNY